MVLKQEKKRKPLSSLLANKQLNRGTKTQKHKKEPKQRHVAYAQGNKEKEVENSN